MLSLGNHPKYNSLLLKFKFWYTPSESKGVTYVMSEQFAKYGLGDTIRGSKRYVIPQLGNRIYVFVQLVFENSVRYVVFSVKKATWWTETNLKNLIKNFERVQSLL